MFNNNKCKNSNQYVIHFHPGGKRSWTTMDNILDSPSLAAQHLPLLNNFWQAQLQAIELGELDFKNYQLPLARIKKVMKTDDDVKHMMISAEVHFAYWLRIFDFWLLGSYCLCQGLRNFYFGTYFESLDAHGWMQEEDFAA